MRKLAACIFCLLVSSALGQANPPLLLRNPALSKTQIVFNYGGNLWIVSRDGGDAGRLTSGTGTENEPVFSPDGNWVAFTGEYDGNPDVFVIPAAGGVPKRLTYHPGVDRVVGWTPDGKSVLFLSARSSSYGFNTKLFAIALDGTFPREYPLPVVDAASLSPDGTHAAYIPHGQWQRAWKRYRGGQTTPIWIADLTDSRIEKVPRENSNDFNPMWVGETVYFLSDRTGPVTLFAYDIKSKQVNEVIKNDGLDFKAASAGPDAIVIEQFGAIKLYDLSTRRSQARRVRVEGDIRRCGRISSKSIPSAFITSGSRPPGRALSLKHGARSSPFPPRRATSATSPARPAVAERDPAWSPDGKSDRLFLR